MNQDRIEKSILLRAPRTRVWRALADAKAFGEWFGVKLNGSFAPGARLQGQLTLKGYEHYPFEITSERMEPEQLLSWRWHSNTIDPGLRREFHRPAAEKLIVAMNRVGPFK
jgi:uncharacterized protein YndB with AHSA1/START domain